MSSTDRARIRRLSCVFAASAAVSSSWMSQSGVNGGA